MSMLTTALIFLAVTGVVFVSIWIQIKGDARDTLIKYMIEQSPDSVSRLESSERILRWTRKGKSLTVAYKGNVLKDVTYKYKDFEQDLTFSGVLKNAGDFDDMLVRVLSD